MMETHQPLTTDERTRLLQALRRNVTDGAALWTRPDTSFAEALDGEVPDAEVVTAIRSVPCHY